MKVSFIIQDMFARGAQYVTARMVQGFIDKGFEVDLIVSQYHCKYLAEGMKNYFPVPEKTNWIKMKHLHAKNNVGEIRRYLKTTDALAIFSMCTGYTHALRIASIGLHHRPKLVHVEHFLAGYDDSGQRFPTPLKISFSGFWRHWYWSGFDRVFTITQEGANDFLRMNPWYLSENVRVVNNPALDDDFWVRAKEKPSHPWLLEKNSDWKTFVAADAFVESKGHRYLFAAMNKIAQKKEKIRVILFGEGNLHAEYSKIIETSHLESFVSLGGYSLNIPAELAHAHGYVKTSLVEPFGISLVEGLAAGCKIVSFDCPFGPREILANGKYGRLIPVGDCDALAEAIIQAAAEQRTQPVIEAWKRYTINATVEKYINGIQN